MTLDLSGNSWEGVINKMHFTNLTELWWLALSSRNRSLIFNMSDDWIPSFNLSTVKISSCLLGPVFPAWLGNQKRLESVTLSDAAISSEIPDWFWKLSPQIFRLDISSNQLRGVLPRSLYFNDSATLDLSFNKFEGPIPLWPNVSWFSLRSNLISGPIPSNIGHEMLKFGGLDLSGNILNGNIPLSINGMKNLLYLDLSNNQLSGQIHSNLSGLQKLWIIDLSSNNLSGGIPSRLCMELPRLEWLQLGHIRLHGDLSFLQNCTISSMDLGKNKFTGSIPKSIGLITSLEMLRLQKTMCFQETFLSNCVISMISIFWILRIIIYQDQFLPALVI